MSGQIQDACTAIEGEDARRGRLAQVLRRGPRHTLRVGLVLLALSLFVSGCSGSRSGTTSAPGTEAAGLAASSASPSADTTGEPAPPSFDPANFVEPTSATNEWLPLEPGTQWEREGRIDGSTEGDSGEPEFQIVSTVTDVVREIEGVKAIAVLDQEIESDEVVQVSVDYFGHDRDGNVWFLGSYQEAYEDGEFTESTDSWLGTADGGVPGVLMPSQPTTSTPRWFVSDPPGESASAAEVADTGRQMCVPLACYDDVLVIREGNIDDTDNELKFYASGDGQIFGSPDDDSENKEVEELVALTRLPRNRLADISRVVLDLESAAMRRAPEIFGSAPRGERVD